jgi:mannitol-1-phosphate 5-dehydrogenase
VKKAVQFGAGNIGRGFLAQLFSQSGYEVVFVEIDEKIIEALNRNNSYLLKIIDENSRDVIIKNVRAVNSRDIKTVAQEIKSANIIATAVGVNVLDKIAPPLAEGIKLRADSNITQPLNIIICENLLNSAEVLKGYIEKYCHCPEYIQSYVGFVESVVSRMIPRVPDEIKKKDPTLIMVEEYCILPVNKEGFKGEIPQIKGIVPCENFRAYEERKLFVHNLGHAVCAYLGYLKNYQYIWQAVEDTEINSQVRKALAESGSALIKKYKFPLSEMDNHIEDLLRRFANKALGDTVYRVGREPIRKLGPYDRLIGGAKLALKFDIIPENISLGIAAGLCYDYPEDKQAVELKLLLENKGVEKVLKEISQIDPKSELGKLIVNKYYALKRKYGK